MTTAHRPTWHTAKGGTEQGGNVLINPSRAYSSKDMPAHTTLKVRTTGQGNVLEQGQIDFRRELLEREADANLVGKKRPRDDPGALALQDQDEEEILDSEDDEVDTAAIAGIDKRFKGEQLNANEKEEKRDG